MAKLIADFFKEQSETLAKQEIVLKLMKIRFDEIPEEVFEKVASIDDISSLDLLIERVLTAQSLDEIGLPSNDNLSN